MSHTEPVHAISVYFRRTPDTVKPNFTLWCNRTLPEKKLWKVGESLSQMCHKVDNTSSLGLRNASYY